MTSPAREGQTFAGQSLLVRYVNFVKLPHTLFALPFALLGVLAASRVERVTLRTVVLGVVAFSAARWTAMGFNRVGAVQACSRVKGRGGGCFAFAAGHPLPGALPSRGTGELLARR